MRVEIARRVLYLLFLVLGGFAAAAYALAQSAAPPLKNLLVIHLERKVGDHVEPMSPGHVFKSGDVIRFRVTGGAPGYLYVLDRGSSGSYATMFPADTPEAQNHIAMGVNYFVPAEGDGWFEVQDPPGFDTLYFLLSPAPLRIAASANAPASSAAPQAIPDAAAASRPEQAPPPGLLPRCNDSIFKARGECIDDSAGPAPLPRDAALPPQISVAAPQVSRDIFFSPGTDEDSVTASVAMSGPVVYTFRLAHR